MYERHERASSDPPQKKLLKKMRSDRLQFQIDEFKNILNESLKPIEDKRPKRRSGPKEKVPNGPMIPSNGSEINVLRINMP